MSILLANNASTTLATAIGALDTSITVADGSSFPTISGSNYFYITIENAATTVREIVKCTARSGNTLTIVRAQDDSYANIFAIGSTVQMRINKATLQDVVNQGLTGTVTTFSGGSTGFTPNTASSGAVTLAGTLAIGSGGTGQTTANAALNALVPSQTSNSGKFLTTDGSNTSWASSTGGVSQLVAGTNISLSPSGGTGVVTINASGGITTSTANTWTATQTFNGSSSTFASSFLNANEIVNVVAAAPSATTNFYIQSGGVQYYTSNAANNWTLNVAFSSGTTLNSALAIGQSVTFTLVTTQTTTAYYNSAVTIDGTSVTPKWIGGAPTAGNASGLDVYRYAIIKTAASTYTVLATLTQFK